LAACDDSVADALLPAAGLLPPLQLLVPEPVKLQPASLTVYLCFSNLNASVSDVRRFAGPTEAVFSREHCVDIGQSRTNGKPIGQSRWCLLRCIADLAFKTNDYLLYTEAAIRACKRQPAIILKQLSGRFALFAVFDECSPYTGRIQCIEKHLLLATVQ
jgi:hypothetical protein